MKYSSKIFLARALMARRDEVDRTKGENAAFFIFFTPFWTVEINPAAHPDGFVRAVEINPAAHLHGFVGAVESNPVTHPGIGSPRTSGGQQVIVVTHAVIIY
ncbi:hypothetical protein HUJ04_006961 [Dendroctonus ponderosae]|nr:hypothetical protein HUJ04_006961 [Dendroctonus ponderosae]